MRARSYSQRRDDRALHRKPDTLANALAAQMRHQLDRDRDRPGRAITELQAVVRLE